MAPPSGSAPPVIIVNPVAGGQRFGERWLEAERILVERLPRYEVRRTRDGDDAGAMARAALEAGATLVVSAGGDGTHAQVARAFFDHDGRAIPQFEGAALGLLPLGRGNDLVRALGLPRRLPAAIDALARPARGVDAMWLALPGVARPRLVLNVLSVGVGAAALAGAQRLPRWWGGPLRYLAAGLWALMGSRRPRLELSGDGGLARSSAPLLLAVCNGSSFGGGIRVAPLARPTDGAFEVVAIERGVPGALLLLPRLLLGRHLGRSGVSSFATRGLEVRSATAPDSNGGAGPELECDGERLGPVTLPFRVDIAPAALRVAGA